MVSFQLNYIVGILYLYVNPQLLITLCAIGSTIFIALVPWMRSLQAIIGTLVANGVFNGMMDTAGNMFVLHLWGTCSAPFMQGQNQLIITD